MRKGRGLVKSVGMKRNLILLLLGLVGLGLSLGQAQAAASFTNSPAPNAAGQALIFGTFPLMPGLEIIKDKDLIVLWGPSETSDVKAEGMVDIDDLYTFYQTRLPEMGWQQINGKTFYRGDKQFVVDAKSSNNLGLTIVHFSIGPLEGSN